MARPLDVARFVMRSSKRIAVTVVGAALLLAGVAMVVLPGPGTVLIVLGFAVLGTEYAWAAVALEKTKRTAAAAAQRAKSGVTTAGRTAGRAAGSARRLGRRR